MSINALSFASARHALQLCVSVLVELGSQERITLCLADVLNSRCNWPSSVWGVIALEKGGLLRNHVYHDMQ